MVTKVFGRIDGKEVILDQAEGDRWEVPVPLDQDGEYVVEIIAEDEAGNQSLITKMLYTVDAGSICIQVLPANDYIFERQQYEYQFITHQQTGYQFNLTYPAGRG
jgi:hypothetical protein